MNVANVSRKTVSILIFAAWMLAAVSVNRAMMSEKLAFRPPADEPPFVWQPDLYRILTFGNVPAAVDSLLLHFLIEDNIQHVEKGVVARVYYYLDLATDLDPAFYSLYTAGAGFLSIVRNDKQSALKIITKGENFRKNELPKYPESMRDEYWGEEWRIPFLKGYIHLFELNDIAAAAAAYGEVEKLPGTPVMVRKLAEHLDRPGGMYEVGMNVLKFMIANEENPKIADELRKQLQSLNLSLQLLQLNQKFAHYKGGWEKFKREKRVPDVDAFGGKVFVNSEGRIDTTTERLTVLGIK